MAPSMPSVAATSGRGSAATPFLTTAPSSISRIFDGLPAAVGVETQPPTPAALT